MPRLSDEFLLALLQACAQAAPRPLYPVHFAHEAHLDRDLLDDGLDELRRRGLVHLTEWVKGSGQGCALTDAGRLALSLKRLDPLVAGAPADSARAHSTYERGEVVRAGVYGAKTAYVSRTILALNILYFAYGAFYAWQHDYSVNAYLAGTPTGAPGRLGVLAELGALHPALVFPPHARPQFERIVLAMFLHGGLFHLGMNMYFLFSIGPLIEGMWGSFRFAVIYFVSGLVSGCVVLLIALLQQQGGLTIGASGALFGIFVALIVWFLLNRQHLPARLTQAWSRNIGTNVLLLFVINFFPGISWQGHLGGAVGGLLTSLLLHVQRFHPNRFVRLLALLGIPLIPIAFFVAVLWEAGWLV